MSSLRGSGILCHISLNQIWPATHCCYMIVTGRLTPQITTYTWHISASTRGQPRTPPGVTTHEKRAGSKGRIARHPAQSPSSLRPTSRTRSTQNGRRPRVCQPLIKFGKDSKMLLNRCTKPDRKEFQRTVSATAIGFAMMGAFVTTCCAPSILLSLLSIGPIE